MTLPEGYHNFAAGEDLTADNLEGYCELQGIMRFADAATRDSALSAVKVEGMMAYLKDVNTITVYSGSAWSTIGPVQGALTSWTPTVTQSGSVTVTVAYGKYLRIGRMIFAQCVLGVTGSGTGANDVVIGSLPATAATNSPLFPVGTGVINDSSATPPAGGTAYPGFAVLASTTTVKIMGTNGGILGSTLFTAGLASGDTISASIAYEAAADA